MTKIEINMAIARLLYPENDWEHRENTTSLQLSDDGSTFQTVVNYCENWADLMPLVKEHRVLMGDKAIVYAILADDSKRALAECLLKVLQQREASQAPSNFKATDAEMHEMAVKCKKTLLDANDNELGDFIEHGLKEGE